jgi:hypothetical protein
VNLPKNPQIVSALPIQDINYDSTNILALTFPYRYTVGPYFVFVSFHILNRQSGSKGRNLSIHRQLIMLVQGRGNMFFTQKLHVQMANSHRSPLSQTNTQPMPYF